MKSAGLGAPRRLSGGNSPTALVRHFACLGWALVVLTWFVAVPTVAHANGATVTEVFRTEQGPYDVTVRILGPQLTVGNAHLTVIVMDAATETLIPRLRVTIEAVGPDGSLAGPVFAPGALTVPQYYDADLPLDTVGQWQFLIKVQGPPGNEEISFPLDVTEATVNWGVVVGLLVLVLLALPLLVVGYRSLRGRTGSRSR